MSKENFAAKRVEETEVVVGEKTNSQAQEVDLSRFSPSISNGSITGTGEAGVLSIINSKSNGKRITLSSQLLEKLGCPRRVQFSFSDDEIAVGEELPENTHSFNVNKYGAKGVIYSAGLVQEITERFDLDFTSRVSITFRDVRYVPIGDKNVAIITVRE
ncbi:MULTISPECIES: hypothetical protein [unclassified Geobacillus]|uniref:hypothetical protein n=1 Tax=Geobacillus TaxID=129337 RepID=UPI000D37B1CF|nr:MULTISPECIES: hypothetical protein [unclassified Geobacillus]PUF87834.1 hypothetical protein DCC82_01190 [Geobacillus sp. LYN3]RDV22516.1 hypothetical protein DXK91_08110 [Parageobacillus toebii]TXK88698.1 hypothetical protein FVE68_03575 [Geobacillus sp. AYS3]